jgi:hypothetical protein
MRAFLYGISAIVLALVTGCGLDGPVPGPRHDETAVTTPSSGQKSGSDAKPVPDTKPVSVDNAVPERPTGRRPERGPRPTPSDPPKADLEKPVGATGQEPAQAEETSGTVREKANANSGVQGRGYGGGIITEPVHQYFGARAKIQLDHMEHALTLYKADHDGQPPKTEAEFMKVIIEANRVELPKLNELLGEKYVYDPKTGELMIQRPGR